jgi:hypothetical protein
MAHPKDKSEAFQEKPPNLEKPIGQQAEPNAPEMPVEPDQDTGTPALLSLWIWLGGFALLFVFLLWDSISQLIQWVRGSP